MSGNRPGEGAARRLWRRTGAALARANLWMAYASGLVIAASAFILTYEVLARYFFRAPTDWALELCVFLLIGATFMAAAHTLAAGGHVSIEILNGVLPAGANRWRLLLADLGAAGLCGFVAGNAWLFFGRAFAEGWVSNSTWGPRLWIPYLFVALGMTLLALQYVVQIVDRRLPPALGPRHGRA